MARIPEVHEFREPERISLLFVVMGVERGQEDLEVGESLAHGLVERTHERPDLLQDLTGGRLGEVRAAGLDAGPKVTIQSAGKGKAWTGQLRSHAVIPVGAY